MLPTLDRGRSSLASEVVQLALCPPDPERHLHRAEQSGGSSKLRLGFLVRAALPVDLAEAEMAAGDERLHAEIRSKADSLAVIVLGLGGARWVAMGRDLGDKTETPALDTSLTVLTREVQCPASQRE